MAPPIRNQRLGRPGARRTARARPTASATQHQRVVGREGQDDRAERPAPPAARAGAARRSRGPPARAEHVALAVQRHRVRAGARIPGSRDQRLRPPPAAPASSRPATTSRAPSSGSVPVGTAAISARAPGTGVRGPPSGPIATTRAVRDRDRQAGARPGRPARAARRGRGAAICVAGARPAPGTARRPVTSRAPASASAGVEGRVGRHLGSAPVRRARRAPATRRRPPGPR